MSQITAQSSVLITGGAGFIGASLAKRLSGRCRITLLDNLHRNAMSAVLGPQAEMFELLNADVTDYAAVSAAIDRIRPDYVVHAAGVAGIDSVGRAPVRTIEVNMLGTANILRACLALGKLERVVTFSTSEIFGSAALQPDETTPAIIGAVGEPRWVYAVSKLAGEHLTFAYNRQFGMPTVTLRPFNVYGPGQVGEGALREFVRRALTGDTIELHNDGSQIRSWCYVDDMVEAVVQAMEKPEAVGRAFNVGNPRATETMFGLARTVKRLLNSSSEIRNVRRDQADIALRIPDIAWTRRHLGFEPRVDLEEGILATAAAYRLAAN